MPRLGAITTRKKSTNSLMYGKKLLKPIKQNGKKVHSLLQRIWINDYIKVILTGAGTSAWPECTAVPYFKKSI